VNTSRSPSDAGRYGERVFTSGARKRNAKAAHDLSDISKVKETCAEVRLKLDQATALAKAAERSGPIPSRSTPSCWSPPIGCYRPRSARHAL